MPYSPNTGAWGQGMQAGAGVAQANTDRKRMPYQNAASLSQARQQNANAWENSPAGTPLYPEQQPNAADIGNGPAPQQSVSFKPQQMSLEQLQLLLNGFGGGATPPVQQ